jgi:[ribosomal protein S18]-alanine N-acetyltransferase
MTERMSGMPGVRIERFRWWHIAEVMPMEEDLFGPEKWSEWMFWNELAGGHYYRVALDTDGAIVGYGGLAVPTPGEAWVQNLAVRRDAQRGGLGRILLSTLLAEAARRKARRVLLEVAVDNAPAQKLYAAAGFEPVAVRRGYYQPSNTDALVMTREGTQTRDG